MFILEAGKGKHKHRNKVESWHEYGSGSGNWKIFKFTTFFKVNEYIENRIFTKQLFNLSIVFDFL